MSNSKGGRNQLLAAVTCNLLSISFGIAYAWGGPNYILLMSDKTPLTWGPLTQSESSMVVSILSIGGIIGTILYGYLINFYERRMLLVSMAVSQIISFALLYFATDVYFLFASRLISGISGGGCYIVIPIYVSEIADDTPTLHSMMPIVSFSMIISSASIGIIPLMAVIFMEILPTNIKRITSTVAFLITWLVSFVLVQNFPSMLGMIGLSGCMFIFATYCLVGFFFVIFIIPETKGKSHHEIMKSLE